MKFSSISLITAGLAAIAGSTVAAPGPLYARTLLVDDNLFRRQPTPNGDDHRLAHHRILAEASLTASLVNNEAAAEARITAGGETKVNSPLWWEGTAGVHDKISSHHAAVALVHIHDAAHITFSTHHAAAALVDLHNPHRYTATGSEYHTALKGKDVGEKGSHLAKADRHY